MGSAYRKGFMVLPTTANQAEITKAPQLVIRHVLSSVCTYICIPKGPYPGPLGLNMSRTFPIASTLLSINVVSPKCSTGYF